MGKGKRLPSSFRASILGVCFLAGYVAAVRLGLWLSWDEAGVETFRPANGLLAGALLVSTYRSWLLLVPLSLVGAMLAHITGPAGMDVILPGALIATTEPMLGAYIVKRVVDGRLDLARLDHVLPLAFAAGVIAPAVGGALGAMVAAGDHVGHGLLWWSADMIGIMAVAPAVAGWAEERSVFFARPTSRRFAEGIFVLMLAGVCGYAGSGLAGDAGHFSPLVPYVALPLLMWPALRLGPPMVATTGFVFTVAVFSQVGAIPVVENAPAFLIPSLLNIALAISVCAGLVVAALHSERAAMRDRLKEARATHAVERRYQSRLRALAYNFALADERTRRQTAVELHDGISQRLAVTNMKLGVLREGLSSEKQGRDLDEIRSIIDDTIKKTRSVMYELSPPILYDLGFEPAVRWLAQRLSDDHGIEFEVMDDEQSKPLHSDLQVTLFHAVRELMVNIVEHAQTQRAEIRLEKCDDHIRIRVQDNGAGFASAQTKTEISAGLGLLGVHERLRFLGGDMAIVSSEGEGTIVTLTAPLEPDIGDEDRTDDDQNCHR